MSDQTVIDLEAVAEPAPEASQDGLTARHMVEMLRRHYLPESRPPGGVFAPEIGSPDGKRRADLIWMPTTVAGGSGLHGHEVKVSRSDLLAELDDPTKADPWAQYCTRWWLVVSRPALISGLDIPESWGIMSPPSGRRTRTMTVIKQAPKLTPKEPGPGIARLAAWQLYNANDRLFTLTRERDAQKRAADQLQRQVDELRASTGLRSDPKASRVARIIAAAEARMDAEDLWGNLDEDAVIAAIINHRATTIAADNIRKRTRLLANEIRRIAQEPLSFAMRDLDKAERLAAGLGDDQPAGEPT